MEAGQKGLPDDYLPGMLFVLLYLYNLASSPPECSAGHLWRLCLVCKSQLTYVSHSTTWCVLWVCGFSGTNLELRLNPNTRAFPILKPKEPPFLHYHCFSFFLSSPTSKESFLYPEEITLSSGPSYLARSRVLSIGWR